MANLWNTIHIFGFGTVQLISDTENKQVPISAVEIEANAVVDNVWSKRPEDYTGEKIYHGINCFNDLFADWLPKESRDESFRVKMVELNKQLFDSLAEAVIAYVEPEQK